MYNELSFHEAEAGLNEQWQSEGSVDEQSCDLCIPMTHFGFDRSDLEPAHKQMLTAIADTLVRCVIPTAKSGVTLRLVGHADRSGPDSYNTQLGIRRARSVETALRTALGEKVSSVTFRIETRGETQPLPGDPGFSRRVDVCWSSQPVDCPKCQDCPEPSPCPIPPAPSTFLIQSESFVAPLDPLVRQMPEFIRQAVVKVDQAIGKPLDPARVDRRSLIGVNCNIAVVIARGTLQSVVVSQLRQNVRQFCNGQAGGCVQTNVAPPRVTGPRRLSPTSFEFSYEVRSRPPQLLEDLLKRIAPSRTLQFSHRVSVRVELLNGAPRIDVGISGSEFPSHRVYVDGALRQTLRQRLELGVNLFPNRETAPYELEGTVYSDSGERERVRAAISSGIRSENQLSDMVFFERHPERNGRLISRNEPNFSALSTEWLTIRDQIVRPLLSSSWTPEPSPQPDYGVIQPAPVLGTCTSPWPPSTLAKLRQRIVEAALAERSRWSDGTIKETDPRARARLIEIWKVGVGLGATQAAGYVDQRIPWSAAFISWVMKTAGAGDAFRYSASHREYIKASKTNRESGSCNPFKLFRLNERKPQVGDIVVNQYFGCTNPGVPGYDTPDKGCSHCDIIVKVEPGKITRIGGNLSDTVGLRTAATDSRGYIIPGIGSEPCWGIIKIE